MTLAIYLAGPFSVTGMLAIISALFWQLAGRSRSRADLELEVIALRHQLAVLRRQRPDRTGSFHSIFLLRVWLHRVWPRCLNIMVLVKPITVVQWPPSRLPALLALALKVWTAVGRSEVRDLIRQMSSANPLWGAPRIHGESLEAPY